MAGNYDKWTLLKAVELIFVIACAICKRATDVEAYRLSLYLQKLSREWSLLNNVTWGSFGASFADATYGGYTVITTILLIGRLAGELPTHRRVTELIFLGIGALFYIILGGLELAAIDSLPPNLVDNGIILGTLSLITAGLFLIDMGGPKAVKPIKPSQLAAELARREYSSHPSATTMEPQTYKIEQETKAKLEHPEKVIIKELKDVQHRNGDLNGNGLKKDMGDGRDEVGFRRMSEDPPKRFGIYGKDVEAPPQNRHSDTDEIDDTIPPKMQQHSPVWSKIRKGEYGKMDVISPSFLSPKSEEEFRFPSRPSDPGYVQYTAQTWGQTGGKTPRHSPTEV